MVILSGKSQIYARALFELEGGERLFPRIKELADIFSEKQARDFFLSLAVPLEEKRQILTQALKSAPALLKGFFFALLDNKAFALLPQIISAGEKLLDEKAGLCRGAAFAPLPLAEGKKQELERALGKFFNKRIELLQKEDKKLVGGLLVEAEGYVFDSSASRWLEGFKSGGDNVSGR